MTKLIAAFCNSAKVPKNTSDIYGIKYVMTNRTIVYEQRLINFFFQHHSQDYKNFVLIRASVWHFSFDLRGWCLMSSRICPVKYQSE